MAVCTDNDYWKNRLEHRVITLIRCFDLRCSRTQRCWLSHLTTRTWYSLIDLMFTITGVACPRLAVRENGEFRRNRVPLDERHLGTVLKRHHQHEHVPSGVSSWRAGRSDGHQNLFHYTSTEANLCCLLVNSFGLSCYRITSAKWSTHILDIGGLKNLVSQII